eukprot:scaffold13786_cov31-Tisochrysis_lutea.AAC.2
MRVLQGRDWHICVERAGRVHACCQVHACPLVCCQAELDRDEVDLCRLHAPRDPDSVSRMDRGEAAHGDRWFWRRARTAARRAARAELGRDGAPKQREKRADHRSRILRSFCYSVLAILRTLYFLEEQAAGARHGVPQGQEEEREE